MYISIEYYVFILTISIIIAVLGDLKCQRAMKQAIRNWNKVCINCGYPVARSEKCPECGIDYRSNRQRLTYRHVGGIWYVARLMGVGVGSLAIVGWIADIFLLFVYNLR